MAAGNRGEGREIRDRSRMSLCSDVFVPHQSRHFTHTLAFHETERMRTRASTRYITAFFFAVQT